MDSQLVPGGVGLRGGRDTVGETAVPLYRETEFYQVAKYVVHRYYPGNSTSVKLNRAPPSELSVT